jgi:cellulose synthase/poly-beta-1,6-N-acetylglucosamine synthase-like glycosyltransferase
MGEVLDTGLLLLGLADLIARVRLALAAGTNAGRTGVLDWLVPYGGAFAVTAVVSPAGLPAVTAVGVISAVVLWRVLGGLHSRGGAAIVAGVQFRVAVVVWLAHLAFTAELGAVGQTLVALVAVVAIVTQPIQLLDSFLLQEAACRADLNEPPPPAPSRRPRVSVHVPCYAEPPEVVIATLDCLARLDYDDFEVMVVDNNTPDEALWRPVREHCELLGNRFRFFHVPKLSGAKAGALNYALARTDPDAELVAVVDADYQAEPGFLEELVGAFDDERLAFVQTSHDYRDWAGSAYLTGCYWEYRGMYGGYMRSRSRRGSALTTGTMCLIRRTALERVGGWAEWCCTEDSELSVRLHAAGYTGRYVHRTYGRGLIPEEFAGFKKQRHRWLYGPTQELRRHWRLYLPARWAAPSALTPRQKMLFALHGVRELSASVTSLVLTTAVVALAVLLPLSSSTAGASPAALLGLAAGAISGTYLFWPLFRGVIGCSRSQALRAIVCRVALFDTRLAAGMAGWRSAAGAFLRTDKFPASSTWVTALAGTTRETTRGLAAIGVAVWAFAAGAQSNLVLLLGCYLVARAVCWLAAPVLALSADRAIRSGMRGRLESLDDADAIGYAELREDP